MTTTLPPFADELDADETTRLEWASERIRAYCGWHIAPSVTETVTLDADGGRVLALPTLRMTALTSVTLWDGTVLADGVDVTWSHTGLLERLSWRPWPSRFRAVTVTFVHGYDAIPSALEEVCVSVAKRAPLQGVMTEAAGGVSRVYMHTATSSAPWTGPEQVVLDRYRLGNRP